MLKILNHIEIRQLCVYALFERDVVAKVDKRIQPMHERIDKLIFVRAYGFVAKNVENFCRGYAPVLVHFGDIVRVLRQMF